MPQPPSFQNWLAVENAAQAHGIDPQILHSLSNVESGDNPAAVSPKGAQGLLQIMPQTGQGLGLKNPMDANENANAGATYLKQLLDKYQGDVPKALAAYNAGPGRVDSGQPLPAETQAYVQKVQGGAIPSFEEWSKGQDVTPEPQGKSLGGFGMNLANDLSNTASGLVNSVSHPIDTLKNLGKLGIGAVEKAGDVIGVKPLDDLAGNQRPAAEAVGHQLYNDVRHPLDSLYNKPLSTAMDFSALLGGTGLAADAAGLDKVANVAKVASDVTNPLSLVTKPAQMAGERIYQSALSPSMKLIKQSGMSSKDFTHLGLNEWANIDEAGSGKLGGLMKDTADQRNAIINTADKGGAVGKPVAIENVLNDLKQKVGFDLQPDAKAAAVHNVGQDFLNKFRPVSQGPAGFVIPSMTRDVPLNELEKIKETAYKYTPQNAWISEAVPPATRDARMALAGEIKKTIENQTPGTQVADLNQRYAQLKNLRKAIDARVDQPAGSLMKMLELIGGAAAGHPGLGFLVEQLQHSPHLAQYLYRAPIAGRAAIAPLALQNALQQQQQP